MINSQRIGQSTTWAVDANSAEDEESAIDNWEDEMLYESMSEWEQ